ncbi:MAG: 50S ribosomal protein L24 [Treponema sp.]
MVQKKFKIHKDDTVEVLAGKDKGKRGTVVRVLTKKDAVIVSGVNIVKKAMKKRSQQDQGGIVEIEAPLNISNVGIICKKCGRPTKIGYKIDGDKKVRVCRKCGDIL